MWTSRRGDPLEGNLARIKAEKLIIGHICRRPNAAFANMASWENLTESDLMHFERDGLPARGVQYFSKHEETLRLLGDPSSGMVFEMHSLSDRAKDLFP